MRVEEIKQENFTRNGITIKLKEASALESSVVGSLLGLGGGGSSNVCLRSTVFFLFFFSTFIKK